MQHHLMNSGRQRARGLCGLCALALLWAGVPACDSGSDDASGDDSGGGTSTTSDTVEASDTGDAGATAATSEVTAIVGPEGAVLEGAPFTPLEGVRLEIPAGALEADTEITLSVGLKEAALPPRAFAIGPHVTVGPDTLALAAPGTLTVPVYLDTLFALGQGPGDDDDAVSVKVWLIAPDAAEWSLAAGVAGVDLHTAELPIDGAVTAGAGVKLDSPADIAPCTDAGTCLAAAAVLSEPPTADACEAVDGFCVAELGATDPPATLPVLAVAANAAVWISQRVEGEDLITVAARVDGWDGTVTQSPAWTAPLMEVADAGRARALIVDGQGTAWLPLRDRLVGLPFEGAATELALDDGARSHVVAATADRTLAWVTELDGAYRVRLREAGAVEWSAPVDVAATWPALDTPYPRVASELWAGADTSGLRTLWLASAAAGGLTRLDLDAESLSSDPLTTASGLASLGVPLGHADGRVAVLDRGDLTVQWLTADAAPEVVADVMAGTFSAGKAGALWAGLADHPTVVQVAEDGALTSVALPHDGSEDGAALAVPRALARLDNGWLLVLDRGGRLLRVR